MVHRCSVGTGMRDRWNTLALWGYRRFRRRWWRTKRWALRPLPLPTQSFSESLDVMVGYDHLHSHANPAQCAGSTSAGQSEFP